MLAVCLARSSRVSYVRSGGSGDRGHRSSTQARYAPSAGLDRLTGANHTATARCTDRRQAVADKFAADQMQHRGCQSVAGPASRKF